MQEDIILRSAGADDVARVAALLAAESLPTEDLTEEALALVAERDGAVVGAIGLEHYGDVGLLRSLVIATEGRGAGLGARLVGTLESQARSAGMQQLWLLTIDADGWFEKLGYQALGREHAPPAIASSAEFSSLCPGDAVLMRKQL